MEVDKLNYAYKVPTIISAIKSISQYAPRTNRIFSNLINGITDSKYVCVCIWESVKACAVIIESSEYD